MDAKTKDFMIIGFDLGAHILAGLLARDHGKSVCIIHDPLRQYSIRTAPQSNFAFATRPDMWRMIESASPTTQDVLRKIGGRKAVSKQHLALWCVTQASADALKHVMRSADNRGFDTELIAPADLTGRKVELMGGARVRGTSFIEPALIWPKLFAWLDQVGVAQIDVREANISIHRDGGADVSHGGETISAGSVILCDEDALMRFGHAGDVGDYFERVEKTCLLTETVSGAERHLLCPDVDLSATHAANGAWQFHLSYAGEKAPSVAATLVNAETDLHMAGRRRWQGLRSKDGSGVIGKFARSNVMVSAGFGCVDLWLAPLFARHFAGKSSPAEAAFAASRAPHRASRAAAHDFVSPFMTGAKP